jgi:hypothetical protein
MRDNLSELVSLSEFDGHRQRAAEARNSVDTRTVRYVDVIQQARVGDRRASLWLSEAITTAEFPVIMGNILDIAVYDRFSIWLPPFERYIRTGTFNDLTRNKRRRQWFGGEEPLSEVGELGPYPIRGMDYRTFEWIGAKYGADFAISWESMLADSLDEFMRLPDVLASAARVSEAQFATRLYVDASGPHSTLYTVGQGNRGTAALTINSLSAAVTAMSVFQFPAGVPIFNRPRYLVVPPALELQARAIVKSSMVTYAATAGTAVPLITVNPTSELGLEVIVDPNIPLVAAGALGNTSWFLFSEPNAGPLGPGIAAAQFDRLRGMERPLLLQRRAEFSSIGGGNDPRGELDERDATTYRVVHAFGGAQLFYQATYGSTGAA